MHIPAQSKYNKLRDRAVFSRGDRVIQDEIFEKLIKTRDEQLRASKKVDFIVALLLSSVLGVLVQFYLSEFTWSIFNYGMGIKYTDETILGNYGYLGYDVGEGALPLLTLTLIFFYFIYRLLRLIRMRRSWTG